MFSIHPTPVIMRISLLLLFLVAGCAITAPPIPEEIASAIPEGANTVELRSAADVDTFFNEARDVLVRKGFAFRQEDDRNWRLETEPEEVVGRTALRITLRASPLGNGSRIEAIGHWSSDTGDAGFDGASAGGVSGTNESWYQAKWGAEQRSSNVFGQLAVILNDIPHAEAVYLAR